MPWTGQNVNAYVFYFSAVVLEQAYFADCREWDGDEEDESEGGGAIKY